jgi:hypothetical protein
MPRKHSPRFLALVEDAKRRIREVRVAELKPRIDAGDHFHLLNVLEAEEWAAGRVRGAQHL